MYNTIIKDHMFIVLITLSHLLHEKMYTGNLPFQFSLSDQMYFPTNGAKLSLKLTLCNSV
jgi:hypothetical protein